MMARKRVLRAPVRTVASWFLGCWILIEGAAAYDLEVAAGGRAGSGSPSAVGAASWNASNLSGPFAFGTSGTGEASLDLEGNPGLDASLRGEGSYMTGNYVAGLRLDASFMRDVETAEESIGTRLSLPVVRNGDVFSLSFAPSAGMGFYDDESFDFGAAFSLSYLAGDFLLKPGAEIRRTFYPDDARTFEVRPTLSFVWYPGIPVTADFSFGWSRSETDAGEVTTAYPFEAAVSAVPLPWLCVTADVEGTGDAAGVMSYRTGGTIEFIRYGAGGTALRLPIAGFYSWAEDGPTTFGVSVSVGFSFGSE